MGPKLVRMNENGNEKCSLLLFVALCCSLLLFVALCCSLLLFVALCCSLLLFVALCCFLLLVLVFGACFHLLSVAFCCSSLLFLVFKIESVLSQKPKQANAFCTLLVLVFCGCFHLSIALLVVAFCWYEKPKRATNSKKVQMKTRLNQ